MTAYLYLAPASAGKSQYAIDLARKASQNLDAEVRVCVASRLQIQSWQRRLAMADGALGVRVMTFDQLYETCLIEAGESYTRLGNAVQYRLLRTIIDEISLDHYHALREFPGFIQLLQSFVQELKGARVMPEEFQRAVSSLGDQSRLRELGHIYHAYQDRLRDEDWADYAGVGWLAVESLEAPEQRASQVARDWPWLIVDGFDNFTGIQLALLQILASRVGTLTITLTGLAEEDDPRPVHHRFGQTRQRLEEALGIQAQPLPELVSPESPLLAHIETNLFVDGPSKVAGGPELSLVAAPNRAAEVREAMRWLKDRLVNEGHRPGQVALLARNMGAYQPFIMETAAEFGLPVRLLDGLPLRQNPAVSALLDLLALFLPREGAGFALPRQGVVAAWRSPYLDWTKAVSAQALPSEGEVEPIGITSGDAETLDAAARWGRVVGGYDQWFETLAAFAGRDPDRFSGDDESLSAGVATPEAQALERKFTAFFSRMISYQGEGSFHNFVKWLEDLIGPDPAIDDKPDPTSLNIIWRIHEAEPAIRDRDLAAMKSLKEILSSLVWAEEVGSLGRPLDFASFLSDLTGAVEAATFQPPSQPDREEILVTSAIRARGVPFRAIALIGLAEGEFPAVLREDPVLRESDRRQLDDEFGHRLDSAIESNEREFFYESVTSAWQGLLLTRPRLTDDGGEWLASPFWEEIKRLVAVESQSLTTESQPSPGRAASWPELMESLASRLRNGAVQDWVQEHRPERWSRFNIASEIFRWRYDSVRTRFDGDLTALASDFSDYFHPDFGWSPSSLESYRACPYQFFVSRVLSLAPRLEPEEGLDVAQLGTLYHEILEALYAGLDPADRLDVDKVLAALPGTAKAILDTAPQRQGFRESAWWRQSKQEIEENLARTVRALAQLPGDFIPTHFEARFLGSASLSVPMEGDHIRLHGVVDRVDRNSDGNIRVIDYKTAGPYRYSARSLDRGEILQLPLYALAAQDALGLGQPIDGFYWHIRQAEPSSLQLADYGPKEAIGTALSFVFEAARGARQGTFTPQPPANGCPNYCPAVAFCWRYKPGSFR